MTSKKGRAGFRCTARGAVRELSDRSEGGCGLCPTRFAGTRRRGVLPRLRCHSAPPTPAHDRWCSVCRARRGQTPASLRRPWRDRGCRMKRYDSAAVFLQAMPGWLSQKLYIGVIGRIGAAEASGQPCASSAWRKRRGLSGWSKASFFCPRTSSGRYRRPVGTT